MRSHIKSIAVSLMAAMLAFGCGGTQQNQSSNTSATSTVTKDAETPVATPTAPTATPSAPGNSERPIEFTYLGVTPDKQHIRYKIKVLASKRITQVDLGVKYMDDGGTLIDDTTFLWQNIVRSKKEPIEKGRTYDVEDYLPEGATKAEVVLKRVVFEDGTYWQAN